MQGPATVSLPSAGEGTSRISEECGRAACSVEKAAVPSPSEEAEPSV